MTILRMLASFFGQRLRRIFKRLKAATHPKLFGSVTGGLGGSNLHAEMPTLLGQNVCRDAW
jgi:hypothetical protein